MFKKTVLITGSGITTNSNRTQVKSVNPIIQKLKLLPPIASGADRIGASASVKIVL